MGKGLKSSIIVGAIVLVIAFAYTLFYLTKGIYRYDHWLDLILVFVWVVAVIAALVVVHRRVLLREELVRRYYISRKWVYNHEIGYAPLEQVTPDGDEYEFVTFAAEALSRMSYGFEVAEAPGDFSPDFIVHSNKFHVRGNPEDGIVIDRWKGEVERVVPTEYGGRKVESVGTFQNARDLARILRENGAFE